ncbi:hypothetical protein IE53DRAFT_397856 [Violaceomyces palustris]|uniref:Uncharacterized protein n=1 Tax=Violaceomyces palustris TaxID=1673888 RepID=A0ACD0P691_9BASI|nr:hypothetical protein IE53DRAFT_397856 [Violaceomyces palustris]
MNSYPPELVNHHFACMLVSGLTPPSSSSTTPSQQQQQQQQLDLTEIFNSRGRSTLWDPSRGRAAVFHSVLVDHNVRLPPQKTRPNSRAFASSALQDASASALSSLPPRSPLSPLHPASPLFPDGLIAPIWTRKHRELVPSVYVAFHCLAEVARPRPAPGQDGEVGDSGESLRRKDEELIRIIAERKRSLTERGIKLTVVLLTSRTMLENPQLEARLSYVRRSSGLDSKASLFVLTPVSKSELSEFVTSLQGALYDSALDYYREHARRVKRKRARYPPPPSVIQPILTAALPVMGRAGELVPLSREGWIVRAEYKLATFAELQGDNEEALSRYIEAYNMLSGTCLGSTMMLPPRTKRWAEAKVLADTLNIKIAKLHLYNDDGQAAMRQLQRHLHRFTELSTGWGIGTMTFEFWSWLCKQYRMFADLIDSATRGVASSPLPPFQLPLHAPPIPSRILHPDAVPGLNGQPSLSGLVQPNAAALASGTSPASIVQGAGPFYYLAALCTMERRERFRRMVEVEEATKPGSSADSPALMHEQKVDHTGQITEQLTRSYDSFKRSKLTRLSLMVASKIAMAYMEASQHEMSLRFLERITKSYRRDGCDLLLAGLLSLAAECAIVVADVESLARILFETLPTSLPLPLEQRANSEKELQRVLTQMELPAEKDPIRIDFKPHDGILSIESVFIAPQVEIGSITGFQVRLTAPKGSRIASIRFNMLEIQFEGWERPIIVKGEQKDGDGASEIIDLGNVSADEDPKDVATCLNWSEGSVKAVQGSLNMREAGTFRIQSVTLKILGKVPVELNFDLQADSVVRSVASEPRWLIEVSPGLRYIMLPPREQANVLTVKRRNYKINVRLEHQASAYLEEYFPIRIHCKNEDQEALQCYLDAFLQPAYEGGGKFMLYSPSFRRLTKPSQFPNHVHFSSRPGLPKLSFR